MRRLVSGAGCLLGAGAERVPSGWHAGAERTAGWRCGEMGAMWAGGGGLKSGGTRAAKWVVARTVERAAARAAKRGWQSTERVAARTAERADAGAAEWVAARAAKRGWQSTERAAAGAARRGGGATKEALGTSNGAVAIRLPLGAGCASFTGAGRRPADQPHGDWGGRGVALTDGGGWIDGHPRRETATSTWRRRGDDGDLTGRRRGVEVCRHPVRGREKWSRT